MLARPLWIGEEPLQGKTILLHAEQGLGDTIQFVRYVAPLAHAVEPAIVPAVAQILENFEIVAQCAAYGR